MASCDLEPLPEDLPALREDLRVLAERRAEVRFLAFAMICSQWLTRRSRAKKSNGKARARPASSAAATLATCCEEGPTRWLAHRVTTSPGLKPGDVDDSYIL